LPLEPPKFVEENTKAVSPVAPKPADVIPQNQVFLFQINIIKLY